jgi:signal transduction histidine kinase
VFEAIGASDDAVDELYWSVSDLAETRIADEELETLASQLPVGAMLVRRDGAIVWANDRARKLLRADGGLLPEDSPARAALSGETIRGRRYRASDGRVVEITAAPVASGRGSVVVVLTDATERDRLERADADFVQNAAHQLRTPIAAIASSVAALEAGARDEPKERDRFLAHIGRESERIALLVAALLNLAYLQRGNGGPSAKLLPLRGLIAEVLDACGVGAAHVECPPEVAVVANRDLLVQALANVVSNAHEHSGAGRIDIRAALAGKSVVVDVTDSGPGVPRDARDRVFERFYSAGSPRRKGSGLGLAIARSATEAGHGTLELLPQRDGEGASFRFTLPGARLR